MAAKGKKIIIGFFLLATLVGGGFIWFIYSKNSDDCKPLDANTAKTIAKQQKAGSTIPGKCIAPNSNNFKKISATDNANQFEANYIIAKQLYKDGDKKKAAEVANTVLSSYRAMTQSEREAVYGFAGKLADMDDIARGVY